MSIAYINMTNPPPFTSDLDRAITLEMVKITEGPNVHSVQITKTKIQTNCYLSECTDAQHQQLVVK